MKKRDFERDMENASKDGIELEFSSITVSHILVICQVKLSQLKFETH